MPSPDKPRHLPTELLRMIFSHFAEPQLEDLQTLDSWKGEYNPPWVEFRDTLRSLRLVCQQFNKLATELLFTYLTISVDQSSVERADKISKQPHLAACIRGVLLHTGLYSTEMAENREEHRAYIETWLRDESYPSITAKRSLAMVEAWRFTVPRDASGDPGLLSNHDGTSNAASTQVVGGFPRTLSPDQQRYRAIFDKGHEAYKERTARQRQYVQEGAFLDGIVPCLARLPHLDTLEMDWRRWAPTDDEDSILQNNDLEALARYIEYRFNGMWMLPDFGRDQHCAHVMTILPAKLHDAGIRLRTLRVAAIPSTPADGDASDSCRLPEHEALIRRLAEASQTLESVAITISYETAKCWREFVGDYLRAVLSSQALRELKVSVPHGRGDVNAGETAYLVGRILNAHAPEGLRRLCLTDLVVQEGSLGTMMTGCREVRLDKVYLKDGLWANVVDKVVAARSAQRPPDRMDMHLVRGGEMSHNHQSSELTPQQNLEFDRMGDREGDPVILRMAEHYLLGRGKVQRNPFREHKSNASYFRPRW